MNSPPNSKPPRWDPHAQRKRPRRKLVERAHAKESARRQNEVGPGYWYEDPKYDPNDGWRYTLPSPLTVAEDEFTGHPITTSTIICKEIYEEADFEEQVMPVLKSLRISPLNRGLQVEGMALNFRSREDAAKFRLFYDGDTATK